MALNTGLQADTLRSAASARESGKRIPIDTGAPFDKCSTKRKSSRKLSGGGYGSIRWTLERRLDLINFHGRVIHHVFFGAQCR
jgi:hypothetical protein